MLYIYIYYSLCKVEPMQVGGAKTTQKRQTPNMSSITAPGTCYSRCSLKLETWQAAIWLRESLGRQVIVFCEILGGKTTFCNSCPWPNMAQPPVTFPGAKYTTDLQSNKRDIPYITTWFALGTWRILKISFCRQASGPVHSSILICPEGKSWAALLSRTGVEFQNARRVRPQGPISWTTYCDPQMNLV